MALNCAEPMEETLALPAPAVPHAMLERETAVEEETALDDQTARLVTKEVLGHFWG